VPEILQAGLGVPGRSGPPYLTPRECRFDSCTGHMNDIRFCPDHGDPLTPGSEWPCPVACDSDPIDVTTCHHFAAEMDRRIRDVEIGGNYYTLRTDDNGNRVTQEYRNHQPYGEPKAIR